MNEAKKTLADLREGFNVASPTIVHALRELERAHFIHEDFERRYGLTPIGRSAARKVVDFRRAMDAFEKHEPFWLEHDLRGLPDHIFDQLASLHDATLITGTPTDVFKALRRFVELLEHSAVVKLVSSIYIPNADAIVLEKFASEETRIDLVFTEAVLRHFIGEAQRARLKENEFARSLDKATVSSTEQIGCPRCSLIACICTEYADTASVIELALSEDYHRCVQTFGKNGIVQRELRHGSTFRVIM
jgi:predicted transcriptional regulator